MGWGKHYKCYVFINLHRRTYIHKNASKYSTVIWIGESGGVEIGWRGKRSQKHGDWRRLNFDEHTMHYMSTSTDGVLYIVHLELI